jgi:hypothetical protein
VARGSAETVTAEGEEDVAAWQEGRTATAYARHARSGRSCSLPPGCGEILSPAARSQPSVRGWRGPLLAESPRLDESDWIDAIVIVAPQG